MTKNPNKNKQTRLVEIFKIPELVFRESICMWYAAHTNKFYFC